MVNIPNYLVQAILVTACCCMPAGVVSIVYAAQVNSQIASGNIAGAMQSSANAKMWAWIGFGVGGAAILVYVVLGMLGALGSLSGIH